jgi:tRNA-uridine 2-sulfurtransferase
MAARIVVGMSGGVDSSVAALRLRDDGWDVIGVTLHLWDYVREGHAGRCCAPEDQYDAARVCATLGIPHYTFDRRSLFRERVVDRFVRDYLEGKTPSPCVRCNESVKLSPLHEIGRRLGADHIATGHYARIEREGDGVHLRVARDLDRDQSYFLWAAPMESLRALVLPLGEMTKPEARAEAERAGLTNAAKPDSTDLCFVEGGNYASFVEKHAPDAARSGPIETLDGAVVGEHRGVHAYTVGQRRGTGAGGAPRYVLRIVPERAAVVVGSADEATRAELSLSNVRWLGEAVPDAVRVKIRYRHPGVEGRVTRVEGDRATVTLAAPQRGVSPGQAAVMYAGDRVVGGAWIE